MQSVCRALGLALGLGVGGAVAQVSVTAPPAPTGHQGKGGFVLDADKPATPPAALPPQTQDTLNRINAHRAAGAMCGAQRFEPAAAMVWNDALQRAAEVQARDIAQRNTVSHAGSDGSSVGERITRQQYAWGSAGENAAAGRGTAAATLAQWMASPGHCANMMGGYREVGMAGVNVPGSGYGWYWIMVVASPQR